MKDLPPASLPESEPILVRIIELDPQHVRAISQRAEHVYQQAYGLQLEDASEPKLRTDPEGRYEYIRMADNILLDGLVDNPESIELIKGVVLNLMAVRNDRQFENLFAADTRWHHRLSKWIDMEKCRREDKVVDVRLVSRQVSMLLLKKLKSRPQMPNSMLYDFAFYHTTPAIQMAKFALHRTKAGQLEEAAQAWEICEAEFDALELEQIDFGEGATRLADSVTEQNKLDKLWKHFDEANPGIRESIRVKLMAAQPSEIKQLFKKKPAERTNRENYEVRRAKLEQQVYSWDIENESSLKLSRDSADLVQQIAICEPKIHLANKWRRTLNFDFWQTLARVEQTDRMKSIRKSISKSLQLLSGEPDQEKQAESNKIFEAAYGDFLRLLDEEPHLSSGSILTGEFESYRERHTRKLEKLKLGLTAR